jgi:hypothetical protein
VPLIFPPRYQWCGHSKTVFVSPADSVATTPSFGCTETCNVALPAWLVRRSTNCTTKYPGANVVSGACKPVSSSFTVTCTKGEPVVEGVDAGRGDVTGVRAEG